MRLAHDACHLRISPRDFIVEADRGKTKVVSRFLAYFGGKIVESETGTMGVFPGSLFGFR